VSAAARRVLSRHPPIVGATCVLVLLYAGRDILRPIALAIIASLVVAPLIRSLGRLGLARLPALLAALALAAAGAAVLGAILAAQLVDLTAELPRYQTAIRAKAAAVRAVAERPFARIDAGLAEFAPSAPPRRAPDGAAAGHALQIEIRPPHARATDAIAHVFAALWGPLGEAGVVLVLLLFILLEQETLQDRLVRLAGRRAIGRTIGALADATRGVSRFFFCQFLVNGAFGAAVGLALWLAGVPHAPLWGTLSMMLRFVPYIGALGAGVAISLFAAAVDPGWTLAAACVALYATLEVLVANVVEPRLYGHSTGLSPLAVVVSALFWGTLWGPVGLLVSTPLTLILVVAARHVAVLEPLAILFGAAPGVTAAQRFFQRALSGETDAIIRDAGAFLRRAGFARYCDHVLLPGLALAVADLERGQIDAGQQARIRATVAELAESLAPSGGRPRWWRGRRVSLLDASIGAHLRKVREARLGRWQGSLDVPTGSIVLCAGLATERDDLVGELLARTLREAGVDARSLSLPLPYGEHDPARAGLVSTVFLPYPLAGAFEQWAGAVAGVRALLPQALIVTVRHPADDAAGAHASAGDHVDMVLRSFEESLAFVAPKRIQK
jgi:predicted PurR-regulated permease PerM